MNNALGIEVTDKKRTWTALVLVPLMILTCGWACNTQAWINNVNTILAEIGPAVQIITSLLPLLGAKIPSDVQAKIREWGPKVENDVAQLKKVLNDVQDDLANNPSNQAKVNALIATATADINDILPVFQVLSQDVKDKIIGLVNAVAAAISSVLVIVSAVEGKKQLRANASFVNNGDDFKQKFNNVLHSPTQDSEINKATSGLNL